MPDLGTLATLLALSRLQAYHIGRVVCGLVLLVTAHLLSLFLFSIIMPTSRSSRYLVAGYAAAVSSHHPTLCYGCGETEAAESLREDTSPTGILLASHRTGRHVPARAGTWSS
jgi:hypothetical protein